jgi:aminoglycoside phosphotransferase (APT) family kinase protein
MIARSDRPLYLREVQATLAVLVRPELTSARAIDAVECSQRVLAHLIVAEEQGESLEHAFRSDVAPILELEREGFAPALREAQQMVAGGQADVADTRTALIRAERSYLERLAEWRDSILEGGVVEAQDATTPSITAVQLQQYLRGRLPEAPHLRVERLELLAGGRSKETLLVELGDAGSLPARAIVRKDLQVSLNATLSADEFDTLVLADEAGVPVPKPLLVEADPRVLGGTFMLVALVAGEKQGEIFPDVSFPATGRREIGLQLAAILARIHSIPLERLGRPVPTSSDIRFDLLRRVDSARERFGDGTGTEPSLLFELACRWLTANVDRALVGPIVLRHGDLGLHNMLIEGTTVTAMLDWELSTPDYAVADLGNVHHTAKALLPWDDFVAKYVASGGNPAACDGTAVRFYSILSKIIGMSNTDFGGVMFQSGSKRSIVTANSAADFRYRLARMLADEMMHVAEA